MALTLSDAYSATGAAWRAGPERIYDRMADVLVACAPRPLTGELVADVGAGTGSASRAIERVGGVPVALDLAEGMLRVDQRARPPAVVADGRQLPLATGSCGAVVAAFSFNHVSDPHVALAEAARVVRSGGAVLASAYALDDGHPVKAAVDTAATEAGWMPDRWVEAVKAHATPRLASVPGALDAARRAGLTATAEVLEVPFADLSPLDLVSWRLGMAQVAPFLTAQTASTRQRITTRALDLLGPEPEPLVRRMVVLVAST